MARRPVFWSSLRTTLGRPRLWLFCWLVPLLLAAVTAIPFKAWFSEVLSGRYSTGSVFASLDAVFRADHAKDLGDLTSNVAVVAAVMGVCAMLFGAFCAGGWLQVFLERKKGPALRRFFWGGARYFWRFLRLLLITLLLLSLIGWVLYGWPSKLLLNLLFDAKGGDLEVLASERSALWVGWLQSATYALGLALVLVWGDYTRTRMALHNTTSAVWAGLCTLGLFLWHPIQTLRPMALLLGLEILVVMGIGTLSWGFNQGLDSGSGWKSVAYLFLLGQVAVLFQVITRGARYHAAVAVSRRVVPPLAQPDPWASRVGGPGGPQYPIDDTDDYGVSI